MIDELCTHIYTYSVYPFIHSLTPSSQCLLWYKIWLLLIAIQFGKHQHDYIDYKYRNFLHCQCVERRSANNWSAIEFYFFTNHCHILYCWLYDFMEGYEITIILPIPFGKFLNDDNVKLRTNNNKTILSYLSSMLSFILQVQVCSAIFWCVYTYLLYLSIYLSSP